VIGTNQKLDGSYHLYFAMGNASETIKAQVDFVTDTNMNDGVANVVEEFVLKTIPVQ
jgi:hydroxymethylpyrimidine pyrophosphatase-like HAD family hydrolase